MSYRMPRQTCPVPPRDFPGSTRRSALGLPIVSETPDSGDSAKPRRSIPHSPFRIVSETMRALAYSSAYSLRLCEFGSGPENQLVTHMAKPGRRSCT
jgi:hypothetical protein